MKKQTKVNWSKVSILHDKEGHIFVCGETQAQAEEAKRCYEWLEINRAKPEPMPKGITNEDLFKLYREDEMYMRLRDRII